MSNSRFYFHLLKVTIAQMLKAHGFDRASDHHVLELFTDIAIRYIALLSRTIQKYMALRDDEFPNIKDITNSFLDLGIISPYRRVDKYDIEAINDVGIENFEKWFNHDMNTRMREVARPEIEFLNERKKTKKKSHAVSSKMENLTKALDEQSKQAQMQNPTMPYFPPPSLGGSKSTPSTYNMYQGTQPFSKPEEEEKLKDDEIDYDIPPMAVDEDWVQYLIRDQIASFIIANKTMQHDKTQNTAVNTLETQTMFKPTMLKGTVLEDYVPQDLKPLVNKNSSSGNNDFLIAGPMPEKLLHTFPYYKSDDESSDSSFDDEDSDDSDEEMNDADDSNTSNAKLAGYDYYEHHKLYEDEMEDLDLYGQNDTKSHDLNLFG